MANQLYLVHVSTEFEMVVLAESREEAATVAKQNASEELSNLSEDWQIGVGPELVKLEQIPKPWRAAFPYMRRGESSDAECAALVTATERP